MVIFWIITDNINNTYDLYNGVNYMPNSSSKYQHTPPPIAQSSLEWKETCKYLRGITQQLKIEPIKLHDNMIDYINDEIDLQNCIRPKNKKLTSLKKLSPYQVAELILHSRYVIAVGDNNNQNPVLAIYQDNGIDEGIYVSNDRTIEQIIHEYAPYFESKDIIETKAYLLRTAPLKQLCSERHLIAVNNGIFNYDTKQLLPFTPDFIFLSKSKVNYNPNATNIVILNPDGTEWDIESWMKELSDDAEVVNLLWQILGAIIRPNVHWNVSAWFYSESGNNGKGTLCELMRSLCGPGTYTSIPLSDFGKDFALEPIIGASAIIVDENDVGTYIDKAANLKAIITGDNICISRKFKVGVEAAFHGFMVQCLNEMPRIKDKSDSFFRRQLFVPFTKCFTGVERKYIKQDYLHRREVLEYALYRVLNMNYYELDVPQSCKDALEEYRIYNDPTRQFIEEVLPNCVWTLLPYTFLFDLYVAWYKKTNPNGKPSGRNNFINDLKTALANNPNYQADNSRIKTLDRMANAEPLIAKYDLTDWYNKKYKVTNDYMLSCHPPLSESYRGVLRLTPNNNNNEQ